MIHTKYLQLVIKTKNLFSYTGFLLLVITVGAFLILPVTSVVALSQGNDNNFSFDKNLNKIDNKLAWYIDENGMGPDDIIKIVVDYDHQPFIWDERKLERINGEVLYTSHYVDAIVANVKVKDIKTIASWPEVTRLEAAPDGQFTLSSAVPSIGVPRVWSELGYDGEGVTIAIIDTGIDDEHAGLDDLDDDPTTDDPKVIAFYDAHQHPNQDDGTYEPYDSHGHGSHCAGIAAGTGAPNYDHIGVAPKAKLVGVKIGGGSIPYNAAMRGVEWAIDNKDKFGIDILSNSWGLYIGGPANQNGQSALSKLMDEAVHAGLVVFIAAGNTAVSLTVYSPADSELAMAVGSVNDNHALSFFSSQGPTADGRIKPDICAVGEAVRAPNRNTGTGYTSKDGTSMACPMAAGLGALMLHANPNLEPADVKQILHETSEHNTDARFPVSPNNGYGWGVVEAYGAVKRSRDLTMAFFDAPEGVHEGDIIQFSANTTYTRTVYTNKGLDGMRIIGDDELLFVISIPATWGVPFNITTTAEGEMDYNANPTLRFENNMWLIEAEYHYTQDVGDVNFSTPIVTFQSETAGVDFDTYYLFYMNITLNGMNVTKINKTIMVDNQDRPYVELETPQDGDPVAGYVNIDGIAWDPDIGDSVEQVQIKIHDGDWENVTGINDWSYVWNTTEFNNGWYEIAVRSFDGEEYSDIHNISVYLDNQNTQPVAVIDLISPNPANFDEEVSFSGRGVDDDGYITEYEWASNIDGLLSTADTFIISSLSIGVHTISFRVKDNDDVWSQKTLTQIRINQVPIAVIEYISPDSANEGEVISFSGYGLDERNIIAYNWRSSLDGFLSDMPSFSMVLSPGVHDIYFRVQDDDDVWSDEVSQSIRINKIPVATIESISPSPAREGEEVFFTGSGDDDGSIIEYQWTSDIDGLLDASSTHSKSNLSVGDHVISFRVKDNDLVWSETVYQVLEIQPVPTAFIDSILPDPSNEGEEVSFSGHGEDIGTIIAYNWRSDHDGFLSDKSDFKTQDLSSGIHAIFFSVQNDHDVWSLEVSQDLRVNGAPTAIIDSVSPNPALVGEEVQLTGHGNDDSGIVNYSWSSSINGHLGFGPSIMVDDLSNGDHVISFKVQDTDLIWSDDVTVNLKVHNRPQAVIESISPNPANEGDKVTFSGYGIDDGLVEAYEWASDLEGVMSTSNSFDVSDLDIGTHEVSFRVRDEDGVWSEYDTQSLRINGIPQGQIDYVSPGFTNQGENVNFMGKGFDDGEIVDYYWYSSIDGFLSSQNSFTTSILSVGDHSIFFKVKDDFEIWSQEVSVNIRVNQIPIAIIDSITPNVPTQGDVITFQGHGIDDGSINSINWSSSLDGFISASGYFNYSMLTLGDHIITLRVRDNDDVWSQPAEKHIRVNKVPTAIINSIFPPNPGLFRIITGAPH
jgi:subtilisin family serine protease